MGKSAPTDDARRSYTMSKIKSKNTSIEVSLRKALWKAGIRYRKNYKKLPGSPDVAITKHRIAIFCDGEFWHGKDWEIIRPKIQSNREYWTQKIERNMDRDYETERSLCGMGWTVMRLWGAEIQKDLSGCVEEIEDLIFQSKMEKYNGGHWSAATEENI
jgi:DNA mismatch endonuclease (patch repair protein)